MFGIGTFEFLVIILVAVLVLGPEQLPRVVKTVTKVMSDFRRISTDFQRAVNLQANQEDYRQKHGEDAFQSASEALGIKKKKKKKKPAGPVEGEAEPLAVKKTKRKKKASAAPAEAQTATAQEAFPFTDAQTPPAQAAATADSGGVAAVAPDKDITVADGGANRSTETGVPAAKPAGTVNTPVPPAAASVVASSQSDPLSAQTESTDASLAEEDTKALEERFRQIRESLRSRGVDPDSIPTQGGRA